MKHTGAYSPGTALACLTAASLVSAEKPSPVDAADPLPEAVPQPEQAGADAAPLYPNIVPAVDPNVPPTPAPFTGTQYTLGPFQIRPSQLKMEGFMISLIAFYLLSTFYSRKANKARAKAWFVANEPAYKAEFAGVGLGKDELFKGDGGDEFVSYATGRRGVEYAWTKVKTGGHDVLAKAYFFVRGIADYGFDSGADKITIDLKLSPPQATPGAKFCFAVVNRSILKTIRDDRWDLRTFTTTSEYPTLSPSLIALTETGDITNAMLKDADTGLLEALKENGEGLRYFESLVVSDMPAEEPNPEKPTLPTDTFHLTLTLRLPPTSDSAATQNWIEVACNLADVIHGKQKLVPEAAMNKAKKRRSDALSTLLAPLKEEEASLRLAAKEDAAALKRKLESDRRDAKLAGMTAAERMRFREKEEEKERKKVMRRQVKKTR
ncbi:hypothetical protein JCM11641_000586 [Rhodosporidiobolus odoratus]